MEFACMVLWPMELLLIASVLAVGAIVLLLMVLCLAGAIEFAFMVLWPMELLLMALDVCAKAAPEQARPRPRTALKRRFDMVISKK